ncbi:MAG: hypothetical protein ACYTFA_03180 [Planctomycetota bacterium]|jgi:hypothetical protein
MIRLNDTRFAWIYALFMVGGCASPGPSTGRHAVIHLQGVDRAAAFNAAELAFVKLGYKIDRQDLSSGVLEAAPVADVGGGELTRRTPRLSSPSDVRRVARARVERVGDTVSVYCRVLVQEQTTQTHRLFADDRHGQDTPTNTPIEREAATTVQQNTVWRTIRRDRDNERQILTAIADNAAPPGAHPLQP